MAHRDALQALLVQLLGSNNVYYQPGPTISMKYPCVTYILDDINTKFADNKPYNNKRRYQLIFITDNPDSELIEVFSNLPMCLFDRWFASDNLNHYVYNLFF